MCPRLACLRVTRHCVWEERGRDVECSFSRRFPSPKPTSWTVAPNLRSSPDKLNPPNAGSPPMKAWQLSTAEARNAASTKLQLHWPSPAVLSYPTPYHKGCFKFHICISSRTRDTRSVVRQAQGNVTFPRLMVRLSRQKPLRRVDGKRWSTRQNDLLCVWSASAAKQTNIPAGGKLHA